MSTGWVDAVRDAASARIPDAIGSVPPRSLVPAWPYLAVAALCGFNLFAAISSGAPMSPWTVLLGGACVVLTLAVRARPFLVGIGYTAVNLSVLVIWSASGPTAWWFLVSGIVQLPAAYVIGLALTPRAAAVCNAAMIVSGAAVLGTYGVGGAFLAMAAWAAIAVLAGVLGSRRADGHTATVAHLRDDEQRRATEERSRIARELHDIVAHHMSAMAVRAASAPHRIDGVPDAARAEFAELATGAREALGELRQLLGVLRGATPADLAPQPGLDDLAAVAERTRRAGTPVELVVDLPVPVPAAASVSTYRIVQEALSNVTRHATGAPTRVQVTAADGRLVVDVVNAPPAVVVTESVPGHGLDGMRERVRLLGGRFEAGPSVGGGFAVHAELPCAP